MKINARSISTSSAFRFSLRDSLIARWKGRSGQGGGVARGDEKERERGRVGSGERRITESRPKG